MTTPLYILTLAATLLPILFYLYVSLRPDSRPRDLDDYFIYGRRVSATDFANTSVGYSLQMAALFLFADWGIRYGFGAFWVPLFWGAGFLFLYVLVPRFDRFVSGNWTLHGYLNDVFRSRALQVIAAIATIIGLWGTMMVEIDYATTIYQPFFATETALYPVGLFFLAFGFLYIAYGGYKAEVNTERVQVPLAYSALLAVILALVFNVYLRGHGDVFWVLNLLLFALFMFMILAKVGIIPGKPFADRQLLIPVVGLLLQSFIIVATRFVTPSTVPANPGQPSIFADLPTQFYAQGVLSLISLFLANALWQFVDISSWQRVSSVALAPPADLKRYEPLRRGLWRVMIESPVSWCFGVVFGMALRYSGFLQPNDDPALGVGRFVEALTTGHGALIFLGSYAWLLYPVFVAAVLAIMLSTVNALLSAITFTAFHDLPPFGARASISKARLYAFAVASIGAALYYSLRYVFGVGIQTALYTFYSSQLALFPAVAVALYRRRINAIAATASLIAGIGATFVAALVLPKVNPDLFLLPPLAAIVTGAFVYLLTIAMVNDE